jgi:hypothetical protein
MITAKDHAIDGGHHAPTLPKTLFVVLAPGHVVVKEKRSGCIT